MTHSAAEGGRVWAELLVNGLAFDCSGLADGEPDSPPPPGILLDLQQTPVGEAISLRPGPHIASGANLPPVVRALTGLGAELGTLSGGLAVCWLPSGCWMSPAYFRKIVGDWVAGGAFPALGLTMLARNPDGSIETRGLGFFVGQELVIDGGSRMSSDRLAQLGIRLINEVIARGPIEEPHHFAFDGFPPIRALPEKSRDRVRVVLLANAD